MPLPPRTLASAVGICSSSRTGGVPTTRWLKGIIGRSNVLMTTLLEKNPTTRTVSSPTLRKACGTMVGTSAISPAESRACSSPKEDLRRPLKDQEDLLRAVGVGREPVARLELEVNDRRALDSDSYAEGEIGFDPHRRVVLVPNLQQLELVDPFSDHAHSPSAAECSHRVEATVELHKTIGMARTTTSAIAEKAGLERLTVYRHFPDERALYSACSVHWNTANPPPDSASWTQMAYSEKRLRTALAEVYAYHRAPSP